MIGPLTSVSLDTRTRKMRYSTAAEEMHSRRNALNAPGFYTGSDSYMRKRSLDAAAWHRSYSEKDQEGVSSYPHSYYYCAINY